MNRDPPIGWAAARLFALTLFCMASSALQAQERGGVLSEVSSAGPANCPAITIRFTGAIRYVGPAASSHAGEARLRVEPIATPQRRDSLPPPAEAPAIRSIVFDGDAAGGPVLIIGFAQPVRYDVSLGNDSQSLVLSLHNPGCTDDAAVIEPLSVEQLQELKTSAEEFIQAGEWDKARPLLQSILEQEESDLTPRATELLGLVHERSREFEQARARYEQFLSRYPLHEGTARVRQRLAGLGAGPASPAAELAELGDEKTKESGWSVNATGGFSQFYYRDTSRNVFRSARRVDPAEEVDERVNVDQLLSNLDLSLSAAKGSTRLMARMSGSYTHDFRPVTLVGAERSRGGDTERLSLLFFDVRDEKLGLTARVGRQSQFGYGVFGRFDGARIAVEASEEILIGVQAGFPVFSTRDTFVDETRWFYGISVGYRPKEKPFELTAYWFDQRSHGLVDRQSIGVEGRYRKGDVTIFGLVDYDLNLDKLGHAFASVSLALPHDAHLTVQLDHQYYPPLSLTNAVIGQPVPRLEALKELFDTPTLRQLAKDRSALTQSVTATYSQPISKRWQVDLDASLSQTGGTPASAGVLAIPGSGTEQYYGAQLVGTSLFMRDDAAIFGLRYADTALFQIVSADASARLPIDTGLAVEPRLRLARRSDKFGQGWQTAVRPSLRVTYDVSRAVSLDAEIGFNFLRQRLDDALFTGKSRERATILNVGYRLAF